MWNVGHSHVLLAAARPAVITRKRAREKGLAHIQSQICTQVFADDLQLDVILLERFRRHGSHDLPVPPRRDDTRIAGSDDN